VRPSLPSGSETLDAPSEWLLQRALRLFSSEIKSESPLFLIGCELFETRRNCDRGAVNHPLVLGDGGRASANQGSSDLGVGRTSDAAAEMFRCIYAGRARWACYSVLCSLLVSSFLSSLLVHLLSSARLVRSHHSPSGSYSLVDQDAFLYPRFGCGLF
jgi:hypothetical protein